jgi:hypothetical protein
MNPFPFWCPKTSEKAFDDTDSDAATSNRVPQPRGGLCGCFFSRTSPLPERTERCPCANAGGQGIRCYIRGITVQAGIDTE